MEASNRKKIMYPKVRVRIQKGDDDQYDFEAKSLQSLKAIESLSFDDFSSPDDSPTSVVRIPRLDSSNSSTHSASLNKGTTGNRKIILKETRTNSQDSPVPRPRAVLSSPDNDGTSRSKNSRKEVLHSGLKSHNLCQNRYTQCKVAPRPVAFGSSLNTMGELEDVTNGKRNLQGRRTMIISAPNQGENQIIGETKSIKK